MQEEGEGQDMEDERTDDYWKRKCVSLQTQVETLIAANKLLAQQLQEQTSHVKELLSLTRKCNNEEMIENEHNRFPVFPEELWEIILQYVGDSQDLFNVSRTCNQLDSVLHPCKGTWMFKHVLGEVVKRLSRKDILNCRLVCRKWRSAIDTFLESHPSRRPFSQKYASDQNTLLESKKLANSAKFHLWDVEKLATLRHEMRNHPRNPFVGRSVVFNVEIDDDFDEDDEMDDPGIVEFWELTKAFLSSVGHNIWYIEITEDSGHQKPLEFYKLLRELLIFLPNLKSLKLAVDISHEDYHPKALPLYMANNPLPVMPHLESLDVECFYPEVPQIIHDTLIAMYSTQLSKLHLNSTRWKSSYSRGFVNLTELHLKEVALERLHLLEAPKLGKLCLDLRESPSSLLAPMSTAFSAHSLFKTLSRFSTLRFLKLLVDITVELEDIGSSTRQANSLPLLEHVEVYGIQRKISYSFLLCFPSLKNISIRESTSANKFNEDPAVIAFLEGDSHSRAEMVEVQKYMYTGRMYESNIWMLIPSLKIFSFERIRFGELIFKHACTRQGFEYQTKKSEMGITARIDVPTPTSSVAV